MGAIARALARRFPVGIRYMAGAAFFFSLMSLLVKVAGRRLPTMEVVFSRSAITLLITTALLRERGLPVWGSRPNRLLLVARGVLGFSAVTCFFYALSHLPLAEATVIQYTNPVWTAVIAALFLSERLRAIEAVGVAASLGGVVLVARPEALFGAATAGLDPVAVGVALSGAVLSASAYVTIRSLGADEHPYVIIFYFALIGTVGSALLLPATTGLVWPQPAEWLALAGVGVCAQVAQIFLTKGLQHERAGRAMAVGYLQIVLAAAWGVLFFAEFPDLVGLGGIALVLGGTFVVARRRNVDPAEAE